MLSNFLEKKKRLIEVNRKVNIMHVKVIFTQGMCCISGEVTQLIKSGFMLSYCRLLQTDKYNPTPSNSRFIFRQVSSPFSRPQLCTPKDPRYSGEGRTRLSLHPFGKGPRSPTNVILMLHKPYRQSGRLRFVYFHRKMVGV